MVMAAFPGSLEWSESSESEPGVEGREVVGVLCSIVAMFF